MKQRKIKMCQPHELEPAEAGVRFRYHCPCSACDCTAHRIGHHVGADAATDGRRVCASMRRVSNCCGTC